MRKLLFIGIGAIFQFSCSKDSFHSTSVSHRSDSVTSVDFAMTPGEPEALALTPTSKAFIKGIDVLCDNKKTVLSFELTPDNQSIKTSQSLKDCEYVLKNFQIEGEENRPIANPVYNYAQATGMTKDGTIYSVFDLRNDKNEILDRKLVASVVKVEQAVGCPDFGCFVNKVTVNFTYSELKRSDVILENNIRVQEVGLGIAVEEAPRCNVSAQFLHSAGKNPTLEITMQGCSGLFSHREIALGVGHHRYNHVYQIRKTPGDPEHIVGLHELIDSYQVRAQMTSGSFKITLSLEDIKKITKKDSWVAAIREDFVLAIRNKDGKSIRYYVIDNTCTSDLVDRFQDVISKAGKASWEVSSPGPQNMSYFKINGLVFDKTKPAVEIPGFCIDTDRQNEVNVRYEGDIFLSYDLDRLYRDKIVERPEAMPAVNWLINKYYGKNVYTYGELQKAIWNLLDDKVITNGLGPVDENKVKNLVLEARRDGAKFVPTKAQEWIAIVLVPYKKDTIENQSLIGIVKIPADLCVAHDPKCK